MRPNHDDFLLEKKPVLWLLVALAIAGLLAFIAGLLGAHPEKAWQAYLMNFLFWSAIAQGGLLFSAVMTLTNARWGDPMARLAEAFSAFFPISFILFLLLFLGRNYVFPWLHEDLHGKEIWLNIPFLFTRDCLGLLILYGLGYVYLFYALGLQMKGLVPKNALQAYLCNRWAKALQNEALYTKRMRIFSGLYIFAYAVILSLIGFDLIMSMDPHWISTLFGAYVFVKAFFISLGALIILAAIYFLCRGESTRLVPSHFHDVGKLFFAFCILWADFFYVHLVVIWYGNIPEETHYLIERVSVQPWRTLAWTIFIISFIIPFFVLLNRKIKSRPKFMIGLSTLVLFGIWLEHLLLLGPVYQHGVSGLPFNIIDILVTLGFLSLMVFAVQSYFKKLPVLLPGDVAERNIS